MDFVIATRTARQTPPPNDEDKLRLYGLYKQAIVGDAPLDAPGWLSGFTAKMKWNAWNNLRGMSSRESKTQYINVVKTVCH